jgi:hypothetical protein
MICDYQKFSGPKPPEHVLKQCIITSSQRNEYESPAPVEALNAEQVEGVAASPSGTITTRAEEPHTEMRKESTQDVSPVSEDASLAAKAEAEMLNATLGDYRVRVELLQLDVVKELCKIRKIGPPETALRWVTDDDLRKYVLFGLPF